MAKLRPKAVFLDFYGTVVEEIHLPVKTICQEVCRASGNSVTEMDFIRYWVKSFEKLSQASFGVNFRSQREIEKVSLQSSIEHFGLGLDSAELARELVSYRSSPRLFPESTEILNDIVIPICLVTNIDNLEIKQALHYTGLSFAFVVTSEDCRAYKPRPEVFRQALTLVGLKPEEVLHIGDSWQSDVLGARSCAIPVMWINRRNQSMPKDSEPPNYVAPDLNALSLVL